MANLYLRDGLGKTLPRHKLMQSLLINDFKERKINAATQTELRGACCCGRKPDEESAKRSFVRYQIKKIDSEMTTKCNGDHHRELLTSIRERVVGQPNGECCSCSESWSDSSSENGPASITFPRETRNAISLLFFNETGTLKAHNLAKTHPDGANCSDAWPEASQIIERNEYTRLIKPEQMVSKITAKRSKNKLFFN